MMEAELINKLYREDREALATSMLHNAIASFRDFLAKRDGPFVNSMKIEYRFFVVELLLMIEDDYKDTATASVVMK